MVRVRVIVRVRVSEGLDGLDGLDGLELLHVDGGIHGGSLRPRGGDRE